MSSTPAVRMMDECHTAEVQLTQDLRYIAVDHVGLGMHQRVLGEDKTEVVLGNAGKGAAVILHEARMRCGSKPVLAGGNTFRGEVDTVELLTERQQILGPTPLAWRDFEDGAGRQSSVEPWRDGAVPLRGGSTPGHGPFISPFHPPIPAVPGIAVPVEVRHLTPALLSGFMHGPSA